LADTCREGSGVTGAHPIPAILNLAQHDPESRVSLEAAAPRQIGSDRALELLRAAIDNPQFRPRMEAVLALSDSRARHWRPAAPTCLRNARKPRH